MQNSSSTPITPFHDELASLQKKARQSYDQFQRELQVLGARHDAAPNLGLFKKLTHVELPEEFLEPVHVDATSRMSWGEQAFAKQQAVNKHKAAIEAAHDDNAPLIEHNKTIIIAVKRMLVDAGAPLSVSMASVEESLVAFIDDRYDFKMSAIAAYSKSIEQFRNSNHTVGVSADSAKVAAPAPAPSPDTLTDAPQEQAPAAPAPTPAQPEEKPAPRTAGIGQRRAEFHTRTQPQVHPTSPAPRAQVAPTPARDSGAIRRPTSPTWTSSSTRPVEQDAPLAPTPPAAKHPSANREEPVMTSEPTEPAPFKGTATPSVFRTGRPAPATRVEPTIGKEPSKPAPEPAKPAQTVRDVVDQQTLNRLAKDYNTGDISPSGILEAMSKQFPMVKITVWLTLCAKGYTQYLVNLKSAVNVFVPTTNMEHGVKEELDIVTQQADKVGGSAFDDLAFQPSFLSRNWHPQFRTDVNTLMPLLLKDEEA